jgi:hypothetical protein
MKIVKNIFIAIIVLLVILLLVAAFIPSEFMVEREVAIEKPKAEVFEFTKYLKNQDMYSVWALIDPQMNKEFRGEDATVGFVSAWDSENPDVGKGEQEIIAIDGENRIDYQLRFLEPFESTSNAYMVFDMVDSTTTKVLWGFEGEMPYPSNLMLLFVDMDTELGKDLKNGLSNLKEILEK